MSINSNKHWLKQTLEALKCVGYAIVEDVLDDYFLEATRTALYKVQEQIVSGIGAECLNQAGELGVLRFMTRYDSYFFRFLEVPAVLQIIDQTVSNTAILHLQNGFILPSFPGDRSPKVFQNQFHQDFRRVLNGYVASINIFFAIDEFTDNNGATLVVPGSHQKLESLDPEYMQENAIAAVCPAGSMLVFDSTLWHAAGVNTSGQDRLAINHQFTRSYFKQQVDYVRSLSSEVIMAQAPRTQQLLGYYTRLPCNPDEYYRPESERLYRSGQG
ncbi:phytanoyl-CoA dioxygenase family protein [Phormidium sp. CLA17]|uniref:phytanoyl-CoA dioxygenase family protein n=1 Tax=Leptolyngbya sp. Cla-17 TaxID=2803751 RepID=UPI001931CC7D|nr:phytanoyl-CoA dioxygenase family protein [Leptolyngbya sp. Cla-17]MBM0740831.1 phytanoyl-CoA dioxygenase family protein [Leptolyngbya sp. Cla-17]